MSFPWKVTLRGSTDIDPTDRQSFKQFGRSPLLGKLIYGFRNDEGRLLYVGITESTFMRWSEHAKQKPWWDEVAHAEVWACRDARNAREVEKWCIQHLDPIHNIHHSRRGAAA